MARPRSKNMLAASLLLWSAVAVGVDQASVTDHVALVGVISESRVGNKGIAVLRDQTTNKTYTVRIGEKIPFATHLVLKSVGRNTVNVADGEQELQVSHAGTVGYEDDAENTKPEGKEDEALQTLFNRYYSSGERQPIRIWMPESKDNELDDADDDSGSPTWSENNSDLEKRDTRISGNILGRDSILSPFQRSSSTLDSQVDSRAGSADESNFSD